MMWVPCPSTQSLPVFALAILIGADIGGLATPAMAQIPCRYELVATIQGPSCGATGIAGLIPTAISPNGLYVTGWYSQCDTGEEAFIWIGPPPGVRFKIPRPASIGSAHGYDVNDSGMVTGYCTPTDHRDIQRGFFYKYQTNQWITLSPEQPDSQLQPAAVNNAGTVVGYRSIRNNNVPREAFIWNESTGYQGLGVMIGPSSGASDISENGIVVGWTGVNTGCSCFDNTRAFIFDALSGSGVPTILGPVPGGLSSIASGVNSNGHVVVEGKTQSTPAVLYHSFVYHAGVMNDLPTPSGFDRTSVSDLTDSGMAFGACGNSAMGSHSSSCLWYGGAVALLKYRISPIPWKLANTDYIADSTPDGVLLVYGFHATNGRESGFIIRPLPESPGDPKCCSFPGDANCDQVIDVDDLLRVINSWGPCRACPADLNHNNLVNTDDLLIVIANWSL